MNRKQLFVLWLPLVWLALPLAIGVGACREPAPVVPCPDIVTVESDAGVRPHADSDAGDEEYTEPFDTPSGYAAPRCAAACRNVLAKKCPEAKTRRGEDSCYVVCQRIEATGKIDFKTDCLARATSQAAIRACGTYRCGGR